MATLPVVAPAPIAATTCVSLQLTTTAATPPIITNPEPCTAPKLEPVILTRAPITALAGVMLLITGGWIAVKFNALLGVLFTVTTTLPVAELPGTRTTISLGDQLKTVQDKALNVTVLLP